MHDYVLRRLEPTARQALTIPLLAMPSALAAVRERVALHCAAWGCEELGEVAALCVSELVTNVITHVGEGSPVSVRLSWTGGRARLAVTDPAPDAVPVRQEGPRPDAESGRGIALVDALAARWGVERHAGAKTVWCELAAPGDDRSAVR
ncbi:ATP-binding protein [Streptomyces sp. NPDC048172]|uniref:ATP-binding protein n=1 Tax=Streptomyces sp. NPDC048172 TaxID=3365505 RepID=UPI0037183FCB